MPVTNEWSFTAEAAKWMTQILAARLELPFSDVRVEIPVPGSQKRHDLVLYGRDGKPALAGEVKLPDRLNGGTPFNETVVTDAQNKANLLGVEYFFTWNVNRCVLWKTFERGKSVMERHIEHFAALPAPIRHSADTESPRVQEQIRAFLGRFLERCAAILAGAETLMLPPPDELFLTLWEAALEQPVTQTLYELSQRYDTDMTFTRSLDKWMREEQGWIVLHSDEQAVRDNLERAAKFSCYALATKIIFYKALRRQFPRLRALQIPDEVTSEGELHTTLQQYFVEAMRVSGDYETVFAGQYGDDLPLLTETAAASWRELNRQTDSFDFTQINYEIIGQIFERMLSTEERHRFGQHYTRSEVVDLINAFCIREANATVFDPACGGGTFLVRAYSRKRELSGGTLTHQELLRQIYGLDISAYPAHLTTLNLATRDLVTNANYPLVARRDFFDVEAGDTPFAVPFGGAGGQTTLEPLGEIDAIVGNPPYVRQEKINEYYGTAYKKLLRDMAGKDAPTAELSGRSDIHCYFFTHGLSFLKRGGYIGLLVSSTWLDTGYGFRLQKFLLDHFEIVAVFESDCEPWFTGARVTTAAVILRHQPDAAKRAANKARFAELTLPLADLLTYAAGEEERRLTFEQLRDRIETMEGTEEFTICPGEGEPVRVRQETLRGMRVRIVPQSDLYRLGCLPFTVGDGEETEDEDMGAGLQDAPENAAPQGAYAGYKWGIFLRAPEVFFRLLRLGGAAFAPLGQLAHIQRGVTSGCDKFFFVKDVTAEALATLGDGAAFRERFGIDREDTAAVRIVEAGDGSRHLIEARFLEPVAFNLMEVDTAEIDPARLKKKILLVSQPREELAGTYALRYIEWGEEEGFHTGPSCANRHLWYELPGSARGATFWTMAQRYRHIVPLNPSALICNHNLFDVSANAGVHAEALTAVLNSTIVALQKHQYGRTMGGDPLLKTEVVDVKMMLVPDPRRASPEVQQRLTDALASMRRRSIGHLVAVDSAETGPTGDLAMADRQALDDAVLELLGVTDAEAREELRTELYREVTRLYRAIRAAEKRMNVFKSQSARKGRTSQHSIATEIWEGFAEKPSRRSLLNWAAEWDCEIVELPRGKARAVNNLLNSQSLFVNGEHIALEFAERVAFAEALSEAHLSGPVLVPRDPAACREALAAWKRQEETLHMTFTEAAAEYTADEAMQKRVVSELWRKIRQQDGPS